METMLAMLKVDLGITTTAYDERLTQYLTYSQEEFARQGATYNGSVDDMQLIVMHAAWTWRKRDTGAGMPRMVRYAWNNRILQEKAAE